MGLLFLCENCGEERLANPRLKVTQRFCGRSGCQQARKTVWQREQLAADASARADQRRLQAKWMKATPGYWRQYRQENPKKAERNRLLQGLRRQRARQKRQSDAAQLAPTSEVADGGVAKMDAFLGKKAQEIRVDGEYWVVPSVAKMDAFLAKIVIIPGEYQNASRVAKRDAIDAEPAQM
jgi:hypothetical protein